MEAVWNEIIAKIDEFKNSIIATNIEGRFDDFFPWLRQTVESNDFEKWQVEEIIKQTKLLYELLEEAENRLNVQSVFIKQNAEKFIAYNKN